MEGFLVQGSTFTSKQPNYSLLPRAFKKLCSNLSDHRATESYRILPVKKIAVLPQQAQNPTKLLELQKKEEDSENFNASHEK